MGSLFSKIFLSFWLAALLLALALLAVETYFKGDELRESQQRFTAHAATVAALMEEGEPRAVARWLQVITRDEHRRLWLVDAAGRTLLGARPPEPLAQRLQREGVQPGVFPIRRDLQLVVTAVPKRDPPWFLIGVVHSRHIWEQPLWLRLLLAVAVTGLVAAGLAAVLTRRIRRLREAAKALAAGDLSVRVGYRGRDEVAALAQDFDIMADRVRDLLETQRRLLSDVSHELRSPLARLQVALELAKRKGDPASALGRIEREAERLEELIGGVLSLARLESGRVQPQYQPVDLCELLRGIAQDARFEAQEQQRQVELQVPAQVTVQGDAVLLRSAVENVVRNAIRHTPAHSTVHVSLDSRDQQARIEVCDAGPGVPEPELARLFEPFARVGEARDRDSGGYGLGLAIARRALQVHGGTVSANNRQQGGLRVALELPLKRVAGA